ncbi:hypothetical protein ACL02S_02025 [Nocardia sp. 004]|uniref:hypothetical protein n=1 Tax=Nocardia sp. 004 TaxID=3385978 RepID=UPI0039A089FC
MVVGDDSSPVDDGSGVVIGGEPRERRSCSLRAVAGTVDVTVAVLLDGASNALPYTYDSTGLLFFTNGNASPSGRVYSVPQTGGIPTQLASGLNDPRGLIRIGNLLYIYKSAAGRVSTVPITGAHRPLW